MDTKKQESIQEETKQKQTGKKKLQLVLEDSDMKDSAEPEGAEEVAANVFWPNQKQLQLDDNEQDDDQSD